MCLNFVKNVPMCNIPVRSPHVVEKHECMCVFVSMYVCVHVGTWVN